MSSDKEGICSSGHTESRAPVVKCHWTPPDSGKYRLKVNSLPVQGAKG